MRRRPHQSTPRTRPGRAQRRARGIAAAILIPLAAHSCRDTAGPTGVGRIAPTAAGLAISPVWAESVPGDPVIPIRQARVRLFRLPGTTPEVAIIDTVVPFGETDADRALTLNVTVTMANERLGIELALLDDLAQVAYLGRDTVIAYTSGGRRAAKPIRLRYAGPDTGVTLVTLAPRDTVISVGDALPLRVAAFLGDGRPTKARVGFAVRGAASLTVDETGVVRATGPVAARSAWVVARTATGVTDSVAVAAIVPARTESVVRVAIAPRDVSLPVGHATLLSAEAWDARGTAIRAPAVSWRSRSPDVVSIDARGVARAVAGGHARIVASVDGVADSILVSVPP